MKKFLSRNGESLAETLISLLIIAVTFLFLTGSITASMRVNSRIKNSGSEFRVNSSGSGKEMTVQVRVTGSDGDGIFQEWNLKGQSVLVYSSGANGYYYYRVNSSGGS